MHVWTEDVRRKTKKPKADQAYTPYTKSANFVMTSTQSLILKMVVHMSSTKRVITVAAGKKSTISHDALILDY